MAGQAVQRWAPGALARILVGLAVPSAPPWFSTWIPALFHLVLAGYVLGLSRVPAQRE